MILPLLRTDEPTVIDLELNDEQASELHSLLDMALRDLTHDIAATDNAGYRATLRERRDHLTAIRGALES